MSFFRLLLDCFLPQICLACNKISKSLYCSSCFTTALILKKHYIKPKRPLKNLCVLSFYEGDVKQLLQKLKFDSREDCARLLRGAIRPFVADFLKGVDLVLLMPSHPLRRASRGFNPVELLVEIPKPFCDYSSSLKRKKWGLPSYLLSKKRRQAQLKNAFEFLDASVIKDKKVLIIDDIVSSQATFQAAARCCLKSGASSVEALAVAYQE